MQALNRLGTVELSLSRSVLAFRTTILHLRKRLQLDVELACTRCRPLVDLELLSCHHYRWFRLRKSRSLSCKQKAADECQTGLYLLHTLSGLGAAELSPPQLVSALKTTATRHLRKKAANGCQTGLYPLQALSRLGTAELSSPRFVSA